MLTNREIATLIILSVSFVMAVAVPSVRRQAPSLLRLIWNWKILSYCAIYFTYCVIVMLISSTLGAWERSLVKDSLIVAIFTGLPRAFNAHTVEDGRRLVSKTFEDTFAMSYLASFYLELHSFSIPVELILQVCLIILALLIATAKLQGENAKPALNLFYGIAIIVFIPFAWFTTSWVFGNLSSLDFSSLARAFAMGLWFPIALVPFIYFSSFLMHCELTFTRLRFFNDRRRPKASVYIAFGLGTRLSVKLAAEFAGPWASKLARSANFEEARQVMSDFRRHVKEEEESNEAATQRLKVFAGVDGIDEVGRRLDRREFSATQSALSFVWSCHLGHFRNRKNRYRPDLLTLIPDFSRHGLPPGDEHGIIMKVAKNRQSWYAWRRTVTGWVFAVGGNESEPTTEWRYDGPEPPSDYPRKGTTIWSDDYNNRDRAMNWN